MIIWSYCTITIKVFYCYYAFIPIFCFYAFILRFYPKHFTTLSDIHPIHAHAHTPTVEDPARPQPARLEQLGIRVLHLHTLARRSRGSNHTTRPSCNWGNLQAFLQHFFWSIYFLFYLYHVGHVNVDFKCSYTLDYISTLFRSPIYALHGIAVRAIKCKVVLFVLELLC